MKTKIFISTLLLGFFTVFIHSCSDDFLNEGWNYAVEQLYLLPDDDAKEYPIVYEKAGNATFTIINKPDWLKVESMEGQFNNGIAKLTCSAIRNNLFTEKLVYFANMTIEVSGIGKIFVDVGYNNGVPGYPSNPVFVYEGIEPIYFGKDVTKQSVRFVNEGKSILIWEVKECPEWINMKTIDYVYPILPKEITIICNRSGLSEGLHKGVIIISTNDKDRPTHVINVQCEK